MSTLLIFKTFMSQFREIDFFTSKQNMVPVLNLLIQYSSPKLSIRLSKVLSKSLITQIRLKRKCNLRQPSKKTPFHFDGRNLDDFGTYCYLEIAINSNRSLKLAMETLYKNAMRASYTCFRSVNNHFKGFVQVSLDLFDKMVASVMLCNSEAWGTLLIPKNSSVKKKISKKYT